MSNLHENQMLLSANNKTNYSDPFKGYTAKGKVVSVYDGDTLKIAIVYKDELVRLSCRMLGYDSPEINDKSNDDAWRATNVLVSECTGIVVDDRPYSKKELTPIIEMNKKIIDVELHNRDKYGRTLVKLYDDQGCINDRVMTHHYNIAYSGKGARPIHEKDI
jgi:endonuclease YncB( thermonuclease family)